MKQTLLITLFLVVSLVGFSQQEAQFTNFMFSQMSYNPGFAGSKDAICFTGLVRQQWMGFTDPQGKSGAPQTYYINGHTNVNFLRGGIGFVLLNDKLGFENNIAAKLAYAFRFNLGPGKMGIGLQAGFLNKTIDFTQFVKHDPDDPLLQGQEESAMSFDLSFGAYYKIANKLEVGISSTQLMESVAEFNSSIASPQYTRHYFIHGGYDYELPMNPNIMIQPNIMIKTDFVSAQYDINVLAWYNKQLYAGVTYRPIDAISILMGGEFFPGGRAGISYDITTSQLGAKGSNDDKRSWGTAEIYFNYCFEIVVVPVYQRHKTVLFL